MRSHGKLVLTGLLTTIVMMGYALKAENLLFNSGFELDESGYVCERFLVPKNNRDLIYAPPIIDRETYVSGRQSLRIPEGFGEKVCFYSDEIRLSPNSRYSVSLWMKSDPANIPVVLEFASIGKKTYRKEFNVSKDWKRYSFSFDLLPGGFQEKGKRAAEDCQYGYLRLVRPGKASAGNLWLDNLQLEKSDEASDWQPASEMEASVKAPALCKLSERNAAITVVMFNHRASQVQTDASLSIIDDLTNEKIFNHSFGQVTLAPLERKELVCNVPLARYGTYTVIPSAATGSRSTPGSFAVIGDCQQKRIDLDKTFCVGINLPARVWPDTNGIPEIYAAAAPDSTMNMLAQMGCRFIRDWGKGNHAMYWRLCEPEQGHFNWLYGDSWLALTERHGIEYMPVVGGMDFLRRMVSWDVPLLPDWVIEKSRKSYDFPIKGGYPDGFIYLPPVEPWGNYVHKMAAHFKGRISYYEIMNEPNIIFPSMAGYLPYLQEAYRQIKAADGNAKVVGFCVTGDLGGKVEYSLSQAIADGGLQYADIISFHPYNARTLNSALAADKQIEDLNKLLKEHSSKEYPLWNTELYWMEDGTDKFSGYEPGSVAARFLVDLGEGLRQSNYPCVELLWKHSFQPHEAFTRQAIPSVNYVVLNALARIFEGAKPTAKIRWGKDTICYVYERNGKHLAAFWNYGELKSVALRLAISNAEAQLYDICGNPLSLEGQPLNLTSTPYYLEWKGDDGKAFIKQLEKAELKASLPVLSRKKTRVMPEGNAWTASVSLKNLSDTAVSGELSLDGEGIVSLRKAAFSLPAGAEETCIVPVTMKNKAAEQAEIKIESNRQSQHFTSKIIYPGRVYEASGKMEDVLISSSTPAQHKARFGISLDDDKLSIVVNVKDSAPSGLSEGRKPWEQDCVELFFDTKPYLMAVGRDPAAYHHGVRRLFVLPYETKGKQLQIQPSSLPKFNAKEIGLETNVEPDGYTVKLTIPLAALELDLKSARGKYIGFDLQIDDVAGNAKAASRLSWNSKGVAYKDRCSFGLLKL